MYEPNNQRNKAIWVGSLALLTIGSVLYFTLFRKPEDPSKPAKEPKSRQLHKETLVDISQTKEVETTKDSSLEQDDVAQEATVTLKEQVVEIIADEPVKPTTTLTTEQDRIEADTLIATAIATATADNHSDTTTLASTESITPPDNEEEEEEKSPLLTAAPSTSTSSDISTSRLIQEDAIKLPPPTSTNNNGLNGYWQPPATNTTFQHSMGWPELFPLQQHQQEGDQVKQVPTTTTTTTTGVKDISPDVKDDVVVEKKKRTKKRMTRLEQIEQQRQNYVPSMKSRCNWWPNCTNHNCKYHHPTQPCRYGEYCIYNERCMFLHDWDYEEPVRQTKQSYQYTDN
ncbi:hypothetical protein BC941DRAFT_207620 [Chlamydoabsidia padenii]|nr:hypothetical protein BC941DRAFT_207620 [Chlamydoabsidia padenii]